MPLYKVLLEVVIDDEVMASGEFRQNVAGSEVVVRGNEAERPDDFKAAAKRYLTPLLECDAIEADGITVLQVAEGKIAWRDVSEGDSDEAEGV